MNEIEFTEAQSSFICDLSNDQSKGLITSTIDCQS